jgi:hypothetical protein
MFWAAVYTDSDSSDSSLDRRPNISGAGPGSGDGSSRPPRKSSTHKRPRRKRAAIPVATPRVPSLPSANSQSTTTNLPPSGMPLPLSARSRGQPSGDTAAATDKGKIFRHVKPITKNFLPPSYCYLEFRKMSINPSSKWGICHKLIQSLGYFKLSWRIVWLYDCFTVSFWFLYHVLFPDYGLLTLLAFYSCKSYSFFLLVAFRTNERGLH